MAGTLYIVGGGMNSNAERIFSSLISDAGGSSARFAFVVSASGEDPDETFESYVADFEALGVKRENCVLIPLYPKDVRDRRGYNAINGDADDLIELVDGVSGIWFTGGDQYYTSRCFLRDDGSDTKLLSAFRKIYENGGVIGGSSAGAAIMSRVMIAGGSNRGVMRDGTVLSYAGYRPDDDADEVACEPLRLTNDGLGFFPLGIVDQHFNRRPRLIRSIEACFANDADVKRAFGVSEDTALVYKNGCVAVLGNAGVYIMECENALRRSAGSYENVALSVLLEGDRMDGDGAICLAFAPKAGERGFSMDYLAGGIPDAPNFDDCMDKLLRGESGSVYTDGSGLPFVRSSALYDAGDCDYLLRLRYTKLAQTRGALNARGQISLERARLDTASLRLPR